MARRGWALGVALPVALAVWGCGDDGPTGPGLTLEAVAGVYDPTELTFDPQGSPPPGDVLAQIQATQPQLVISVTGGFQIAFLDPVTGFIRTPGGIADPTADGVRLAFNNQADADLLLLPRTLVLTFHEDTGTLTFSGSVSVPRSRLLSLFPDLYGSEAFQDPTPGTLIVTFERRTMTS
ncbi:MAG TPA: hypothetical protein VMM12_03230 [Longimicrobiales bacterium]|nr:hypothetical protein [Longimicrobiales bacterium]